MKNRFNLHHRTTLNTGDLVCAPSLYFDLDCEVKDLWTFAQPPDSQIIIGGGGLFSGSFLPFMENSISQASKGVLWGIGTNVHNAPKEPYPSWIKDCLVGLRDYPNDFAWVPCPSCMNGAFDRKYKVEREFVVYRHHKDPDSLLPPFDAPTLTNSVEGANSIDAAFERAVSFLGSAEYVITDTYHGAYWATLLGRKVIVYPFSTRHRWTKFKYPLLGPLDDWRAAFKEAVAYQHALEECRAANLLFYRRVMKFLS
jgi:hypothetical protein